MIDFAKSDVEASARFENFKSIDPFPEILPALLNSADFKSYIAATGMIFPFVDDKKKLKTASYEIDLLGKIVHWNENGKKIVEILTRGKEFILHKNSIAFITLEPMLRVPSYIALRFNLKITHVYRGLLLGTGPLIDPGYTNKLSIPLHNLTTNDYTFVGGQPLIWMEFTKLSPQPKSQAANALGFERFTDFVSFPDAKNKLDDVEDYLRKADPHRSIRSSIPEAIKDAKQVKQLFKQIAWGTVVAIAITVAMGVPAFVSLFHDSIMAVTNASDQVNSVSRQLERHNKLEIENRKRIELLELELLKRDRGKTGSAAASDKSRGDRR